VKEPQYQLRRGSCQNIKKEIWIDKQLEKMLPVKHYHLVFTLPHELQELILSNQRVCYNILFKAGWKTIKSLCTLPKWLGGETAATMASHPQVVHSLKCPLDIFSPRSFIHTPEGQIYLTIPTFIVLYLLGGCPRMGITG
jgi:hypothetical protein